MQLESKCSSRLLCNMLDIESPFYADDAVVFLRPYRMDLQVIKTILDLFGHASGLLTNLTKSSIFPIHCSTEHLQLTAADLCCQEFHCTCLGLPLSIHKPTMEVLLPLVDKMADLLLGWGRLS